MRHARELVCVAAAFWTATAFGARAQDECPVPRTEGDRLEIWRASARFGLAQSLIDSERAFAPNPQGLTLLEAAGRLQTVLRAAGYTELAYLSDTSDR